VFLIYEHLKGKKSFWYPYFNVIDPDELPTHWDSKLLDVIEDPDMIANIKYQREEFDADWIMIRRLLSIYSGPGDLFNLDLCTYDLYKRCSFLLQTRLYGSGLPCSMLTPIADCFNHSPLCLNELDIINRRLHQESLITNNKDPLCSMYLHPFDWEAYQENP
jgi:hypothetical protein